MNNIFSKVLSINTYTLESQFIDFLNSESFFQIDRTNNSNNQAGFLKSCILILLYSKAIESIGFFSLCEC